MYCSLTHGTVPVERSSIYTPCLSFLPPVVSAHLNNSICRKAMRPVALVPELGGGWISSQEITSTSRPYNSNAAEKHSLTGNDLRPPFEDPFLYGSRISQSQLWTHGNRDNTMDDVLGMTVSSQRRAISPGTVAKHGSSIEVEDAGSSIGPNCYKAHDMLRASSAFHSPFFILPFVSSSYVQALRHQQQPS